MQLNISMFIARATIGIEQMPECVSIWTTNKIICLSSTIMKTKQQAAIFVNLGVTDSLWNLDFLGFVLHIFSAPSYKMVYHIDLSELKSI